MRTGGYQMKQIPYEYKNLPIPDGGQVKKIFNIWQTR